MLISAISLTSASRRNGSKNRAVSQGIEFSNYQYTFINIKKKRSLKKMNLRILMLALMGCAVSLQANASIITYSDKTSFLADTGATAATDIPNGSFGSQLSFSCAAGCQYLAMSDASSDLSGKEMGISGNENFNVTSSGGAMYSFGFDFVEPQFDPYVNATFVDSTFTVSLLNGSTLVDSFTFALPNDIAQFVGVSSDVGFDKVQIRETVGGIENEFFGQFYTSLSSPVSVPAPGTNLLFGIGVVAIAVSRAIKSSNNVFTNGASLA